MFSALTDVVQRLGVECPWTKQQSAADMLYHLRSEVLEVETVLREQRAHPERAAKLAHDLVGELGDVLFDALLLIRVCERDVPGVSLEGVCEAANLKLRRRVPYMFSGAPAPSIEEAERGWQAAKKREREATEAATSQGLAPVALALTRTPVPLVFDEAGAQPALEAERDFVALGGGAMSIGVGPLDLLSLAPSLAALDDVAGSSVASFAPATSDAENENHTRTEQPGGAGGTPGRVSTNAQSGGGPLASVGGATEVQDNGAENEVGEYVALELDECLGLEEWEKEFRQALDNPSADEADWASDDDD